MSRRTFLRSAAAGLLVPLAPAIVRAESLMRVRPVRDESMIVLTEGLGVDTISMSAVDAQLIESRKFQVEDIARAFGVPPFMIGNQEKTTSWGSGVEMMGRGFLVFTLQPHLKRSCGRNR